ncbi:amidohydrolase family protein [uncultured Marivita sp.]|uniref:amidohydrolase family protein n=1 Tax=uncultured Marivita sp. TaxID=888080 RepID=UPI00260F0EE4|nr:amidohydrolase family protein [uncultured Marivita sp.]
MPDFPIIDAHVHIFDPGRLRYAWMEVVPALQEKHDLDRFFSSTGAVQVDAAVFVEVDVDQVQQGDEIDMVHQAARADARLKGMVASLPLEQGDAALPMLEAYAARPLARGVRRLIERRHDQPGWCLQAPLLENLRRLPERGMTFDLCLYNGQLPEVTEMVDACPDTAFIVDHFAKPDAKNGVFQPWADNLRKLAERPNVMCKFSGLTTEADHATWTEAQLKPYIAHALDCFGIDRALFGGDWPVSELAGPYDRWVALLDDVLSGESDDALRQFYRGNAARFYRLEV